MRDPLPEVACNEVCCFGTLLFSGSESILQRCLHNLSRGDAVIVFSYFDFLFFLQVW